MKLYIREEMVIQFLLKSFKQGQWLFNTQALFDQYSKLISWNNIDVWTKPTLFIRGERSPYIAETQLKSIYAQFLNVEIKTVIGAGHWLHAEKTDEVINVIRHFLT